MSDDLQKHTLLLHRGDYARLQEFYPDNGAAQVIRKLVRNWVKKCEAIPENAKPSGEIDL